MRPDPEIRDRRPENRTPKNLCHEITDSLRRQPVDGVRLAEVNASSWWWSTATLAVLTLARTGRPFNTEDVRALGVPEPDKSCRWGALMAASCRAGAIESAGAVIGHDGRPHRCWVGVRAE